MTTLTSPLHFSTFVAKMNILPNEAPPKATFEWMSTNIVIPGEPGKPLINVCDAFCCDRHKLKDQLILPPNVYSPQWENRKQVEDAIINAALVKDGTELRRQQTMTTAEGKHTYLCCRYGVKCRDKTDHCPNVTRPGVKVSRIVNKNKSSRGKQGLEEAKRAQSVPLCGSTLIRIADLATQSLSQALGVSNTVPSIFRATIALAAGVGKRNATPMPAQEASVGFSTSPVD